MNIEDLCRDSLINAAPNSQASLLTAIQRRTLNTKRLVEALAVTFAAFVFIPAASAHPAAEFHQTLTVTATDPLILDVDIPGGELQVLYGRDGQVSITGFAQGSAETRLDERYFPAVLTIVQNGNHLSIRHVPSQAYPQGAIKLLYRIEVPYRTEVTSRLGQGKQNISGIMGPVKAFTDKGDIKASYVSKGLQAQAEIGNLDIQVIGEHVDARTGYGNISCLRVAQGVSAETGDGDITLMVVGPSTGTVKRGTGRIDVGGARGSFVGSTDGGDIHLRALPHDDWQLNSVSGNVRLELPPDAGFELDAATDSGAFLIDRDDLAIPGSDIHHLRQKINGGIKRIEVHTGSGRIAIR